MFNRKQKEIDRLNARNVELARELRKVNFKVQQRDKLIKDYREEHVVLLENLEEARNKIRDLENNIEFLTNNLSQKNKKLINLPKSN